jgi:RNA polymerase sigma-70 factor (ECF subfamily)
VWVEQAQNGDLSAFDHLIRRHNRRVFGIAYHMLGNREDAEDVAQAVFIKAYQSLKNFRGQSAFSSWIHRIAVNETYNYLKKRKKTTHLSLAEMNPTDPDDPAHIRLTSHQTPDREISLKELQKKLNEALQTLSNSHRTAVVLHEMEGLPHEEIAELLGCSVGTVRSRLFYARKQLQKKLARFVT